MLYRIVQFNPDRYELILTSDINEAKKVKDANPGSRWEIVI